MGTRTRKWRRLAFAGLVAVSVAALGLWSTTSRARTQPNILLVVIDSLRWDRVGALGFPQDLTPFMDQLASQSILYKRAYSPSSWTAPVVAALFSGQYPSQSGVTDFFVSLQPQTTLAAALAAHGYSTSAVSANGVIQQQYGFAQGFERYEIVGDLSIDNPKADGELVNQRALQWVDEVGAGRPHFLYLHYMDAHLPYREHPGVTAPRAEGLTRSDQDLMKAVMWDHWDFTPDEIWRLEDLYNGEVQYLDDELRKLFAGLQQRGFLSNALVIVTADHGEQFGRHGLYGHGASLNEVLIHVPLLVRLPEERTGVVTQPVSLAALPGFILDTAGIAPPPAMQGEALPLSDDRSGTRPPHAVRSELIRTAQPGHWKHKQAVVLGGHKMVLTTDGRELVYDLSHDPYERRPLPSVDAALHEALQVALAAQAPAVAEAPQAKPDAATVERLRAVGYLQGR